MNSTYDFLRKTALTSYMFIQYTQSSNHTTVAQVAQYPYSVNNPRRTDSTLRPTLRLHSIFLCNLMNALHPRHPHPPPPGNAQYPK